MPYSSESKEKETHSKETERDNAGQVFQRVSQGGVGASPPDEGGDLSAGSNNGRLFAFIREVHLEEAQEFRLKGYNSQVPEVDEGLLTQLRDGLAAAKSRLCLKVSVRGPLGSLWLLDQIGNIERLASKLSDDVIKRWVEHELPRKSDGEATEAALGSRRTAQSLARRLESILQTLIRVVHTLRAMDDYSTPEKRHDMLVAELTGAFSSYDKSTVIQALGSMTAEISGHTAWVSLMQARAVEREAGKSSVNAMIAASRHEAEKANIKARQLQGDPQTFFSDVAAYLQNLSRDLAKASIHAGLSTTSPAIPQVNNDEAAASLSRSNSLSQHIKTGFDKIKLQAPIVFVGAKVQAHRLVRILKHRHLAETPTKDPEHVVADSIIRSILWQWQQPAIKIQYASAALLSKVDELKKIEGILTSYSAADGWGSEQECRNTPVSPSGEEALVAQVREWVSDSLEQENPENQRAVKVATLERLLSGDIDHAQSLLARLGSTTDSIHKALERQWMSVNDMLEAQLPVDIDRSLWAKIDLLMNKFMPDLAKELATAAQALNDAALAAGNSARNLSEAKVQAGKAQLLATKVKERLSAESARLTERPLDDHSRGARLAKHWANLVKAQNVGNYPPPDAQQVLASLKEQGLLAGTLSTGDPAGYLFATRLAGELENARNGELRLPMSPEQYAALEKGLVEYIVKWGQRRISQGVSRIVIELSFEQALNAVSFNVSSLFRLPYKVLKASIKIPYNVNKVNNYTMPGNDKPYKAIYGLLGKKLKQLGFNLLMAPVPGAIKLAAGVGVTAGASLHNEHAGRSEKTFSAVYQHVVEGKQSEKIKMSSVEEVFFDSVLDTATTAAFKGAQRVLHPREIDKNSINFSDTYRTMSHPLSTVADTAKDSEPTQKSRRSAPSTGWEDIENDATSNKEREIYQEEFYSTYARMGNDPNAKKEVLETAYSTDKDFNTAAKQDLTDLLREHRLLDIVTPDSKVKIKYTRKYIADKDDEGRGVKVGDNMKEDIEEEVMFYDVARGAYTYPNMKIIAINGDSDPQKLARLRTIAQNDNFNFDVKYTDANVSFSGKSLPITTQLRSRISARQKNMNTVKSKVYREEIKKIQITMTLEALWQKYKIPELEKVLNGERKFGVLQYDTIEGIREDVNNVIVINIGNGSNLFINVANGEMIDHNTSAQDTEEDKRELDEFIRRAISEKNKIRVAYNHFATAARSEEATHSKGKVKYNKHEKIHGGNWSGLGYSYINYKPNPSALQVESRHTLESASKSLARTEVDTASSNSQFMFTTEGELWSRDVTKPMIEAMDNVGGNIEYLGDNKITEAVGIAADVLKAAFAIVDATLLEDPDERRQAARKAAAITGTVIIATTEKVSIPISKTASKAFKYTRGFINKRLPVKAKKLGQNTDTVVLYTGGVIKAKATNKTTSSFEEWFTDLVDGNPMESQYISPSKKMKKYIDAKEHNAMILAVRNLKGKSSHFKLPSNVYSYMRNNGIKVKGLRIYTYMRTYADHTGVYYLTPHEFYINQNQADEILKALENYQLATPEKSSVPTAVPVVSSVDVGNNISEAVPEVRTPSQREVSVAKATQAERELLDILGVTISSYDSYETKLKNLTTLANDGRVSDKMFYSMYQLMAASEPDGNAHQYAIHREHRLFSSMMKKLKAGGKNVNEFERSYLQSTDPHFLFKNKGRLRGQFKALSH